MPAVQEEKARRAFFMPYLGGIYSKKEDMGKETFKSDAKRDVDVQKAWMIKGDIIQIICRKELRQNPVIIRLGRYF